VSVVVVTRARVIASFGVLAALAAMLGPWLPLEGGLAAVVRAQGRPLFEVGTYEGVPWPIIPSPVWPLPPAVRPTHPAPAAESPAARRVLEVLGDVQRTMRDTSYQHATRVRERDGVYHWDCSGMAAWVLRRAAPVAMRRITRPRPVARDFVRAIESAPTERAGRGWLRLDRLADARPGDLFAWRRPRGFPSRNTGHVGFVMDRPLPVPSMRGAYAVRVADATSLAHQDDTRENDEDGGFGLGTLVFLTDEQGRGTSYGWFGTASEGYVVTPIVIGRVTR
jgi:hypothetical protein